MYSQGARLFDTVFAALAESLQGVQPDETVSFLILISALVGLVILPRYSLLQGRQRVNALELGKQSLPPCFAPLSSHTAVRIVSQETELVDTKRNYF